MDEIAQNDVVAVGGGGVRRGKGVGAQSSTPAVAADAGPKGGGAAKWQIVTRGKAKAGVTKRTTMRVRPSVVEESGSSHRAAPGFEAASTAARKRKAEHSVNDKLTMMTATIEQPMAAQKEMGESQMAFLESNKELMETIKAQGEEIKALRTLIQDNTSKRSYSEVIASGGTLTGSQTFGTRLTSENSSQVRKENLTLQLPGRQSSVCKYGQVQGQRKTTMSSRTASVLDSRSIRSQKN